MKQIAYLLVLLGTLSYAQPNELILDDTLETKPLEILLYPDYIEQVGPLDTAYIDEHIIILDDGQWSAEHFWLADDGVELYSIFNPEANEDIDSIKYFDVSRDGEDEAIIYTSRTDGNSGHSGGFSDQGWRVIILDMKNKEIIFDQEYKTHYEFWEQNYDEENDEYIPLGGECFAYDGYFSICEGMIVYTCTERHCEKINEDYQYSLMYLWSGKYFYKAHERPADLRRCLH